MTQTQKAWYHILLNAGKCLACIKAACKLIMHRVRTA